MASTVILGHEADVQIWPTPNYSGNATNFGVRKGTVIITGDEHEVGDTNTGKPKVHKSGREMMEITLDFYEKSDLVVQTALNIDRGTEVSIKVWDKGFGNGTPYQAAYFIIFRYQDAIDVDRPVDGSVHGKANGTFLTPSGS